MGRFVDVKINAPDLIPQNSSKYRGKQVFLSSVTDPYLPLERKYKVIRRIIQKIIPLGPVLGILTKSDLILRDLDLIKQFENCEVGFSFSTLKTEVFYMFENLNVIGTVWGCIKRFLEDQHHELVSEYREIYFTDNLYWEIVEKEINEFCESEELDFRIYFHHK